MKIKQYESELAVKQAQSWAQELDEIAELIGRRFSRSEARERAVTYLRGLLSPVERKNGWQLAEEAGDERPRLSLVNGHDFAVMHRIWSKSLKKEQAGLFFFKRRDGKI